MKSLHITLALVLGLVTLSSAETLVVNSKASKIEWVGKKVTGQHNGTIAIKSGEVQIEKGKLTGGRFKIDMTSIEVLDLEGDLKGKLAGHLNSDDFFGVATYPEAEFVITKVEPDTIAGDLTIKGKTNPLSFPAKITLKKGSLKATADDVKVDRTLYDIRYGSGKFFENLGDKVIYDDFLLDITLVAGK